jgi:hypothetical protein
VVAVVATVAVAGLAWLAWVVVVHGRPEVTSQMIGFDVRGQHAVSATFTVTRRDTAVRASCLLRAFADDHAVVGELSVPVVSGATDTRLSRTVRTERAATTVDLVGCTATGQRSPR